MATDKTPSTDSEKHLTESEWNELIIEAESLGREPEEYAAEKFPGGVWIPVE